MILQIDEASVLKSAEDGLGSFLTLRFSSIEKLGEIDELN